MTFVFVLPVIALTSIRKLVFPVMMNGFLKWRIE